MKSLEFPLKKIVVDKDIPFLRGVLEPHFEVEYLAGRDITKGVAQGAEALIIRTRTRVNRELLEGSSVRLVVTATIGLDHIDLEYCRESGVEVRWAAGCNARGVASWVLSSISELDSRGVISKEGATLGIIGVGNVGGELAKMASERGYTLLLNDPPRAEREGGSGFVDLDYLLQNSDIVTLHVPLTQLTKGLVNDRFLASLVGSGTNSKKLLLNSSRGEVVNEADLKRVLSESCDNSGQGGELRFVCDVWHNEPAIDLELMGMTEIATPHIAGYSARGKARATTMSVQSVAKFFGISELDEWDCSIEYELEEPERFDIMKYDKALRSNPSGFESQRVIYNC